ncbi:conjugative transposon protein TraN [Flavobacterium psychroterrae]|uniref:Conjugative transposon protein TraN n=1 Tax=Flavobacterium psychroterrae TaxID=2133767 RepID=A0ABS5P9H3_9FLAO|nr:conjugative transposon protein TraN [Flavobacterium psychroterrae]MBS7230958.1 conjugative transposon protein TraN [Flavobacterium psychroterrae]
MKKYKVITALLMMFVSVSGFSQFMATTIAKPKEDFKSIGISFSKTTSIIFPYSIKSIDKGSTEILVQKAKGAENILLLKAGVQNFRQTNLTVITADAKLYGFVINYDEECPVLNFMVDKAQSVDQEVLFSSENENQNKIELYSKLALSKTKKVSGISKSSYGIKLEMNGIFIQQDIMYFRLVLQNKSRIGYDIDQLRFFICDQKKAVRTATQEIELEPIYSTLQVSKIPDASKLSVVVAVPKFTIPEKKILTIQLIEKDGGRHLELTIHNNDLVKPEMLTGY